MREKRRRARGQGPRLRPENGPGGNQLPNTPCSRASVPKGHLEIARRFNAGLWSLDILHANGVPAHQPRATPWETGLQWQNPPCKGGGSFRGLRPFRAPESRGFPRALPWADMLARFQRVLMREPDRNRNVQTSEFTEPPAP